MYSKSAGQNKDGDLAKILKNNNSLYLDLEAMKAPGDVQLVPEGKKKKSENKDGEEEKPKKAFSIYEEVKKLARKRYMPKSM